MSKKVNQSDLIKIVHKRNPDLTKNDIRKIINSFIDVTKESLENNMNVSINGFVTFKCSKAKPKKIYSFKDKTLVTLPERSTIKTTFSVSFIKKIKNKNTGK